MNSKDVRRAHRRSCLCREIVTNKDGIAVKDEDGRYPRRWVKTDLYVPLRRWALLHAVKLLPLAKAPLSTKAASLLGVEL